MAGVWRYVGVSIVFWLVLNCIAVYQLMRDAPDGARRGKLVPSGGVRRASGPPGEHVDGGEGALVGEMESEDSASSGDDNVIATAPPTKQAKAKSGSKDSIPRSVGNSLVAAETSPVTIRSADGSVRFVVVGDWGGPGRDPQRNVAKAMDIIATSQNHSIHFVVSTGDNMYEDGVSGVKDRKFKRNFEDVYTQESLQCVWYMSLGNHDHGAHGVMRDAQAEVNYTKMSRRWFLPSTYYAQEFLVASPFVGDGAEVSYRVLLVVLDTYDYSPRVTQMTEGQVRWFESTLSRSTADVKIVVGHRPLFSAGAKHGSSPYMQKKLEPVMVKYGVTAYLCGDDHELQVMQSKGVVHLLSGGGSRAKKDLKPKGIPQTVFQAGVHGFMWASIHRTSFDVEVYNQHAEMLFKHSFPTAGAAALRG